MRRIRSIPLDTEIIGDKTLLCWLHGGLHLYRGTGGATKKRTNEGASLLTRLATDGRIPLFVSEGTAQQKRSTIRQSDYLEYVYTALARADDDLLVFGQAFGQPDNHLVEAIRQAPGRYIGYGVHASSQARVDLRRAEAQNLFPDARLYFFDSATHPLGDPASLFNAARY